MYDPREGGQAGWRNSPSFRDDDFGSCGMLGMFKGGHSYEMQLVFQWHRVSRTVVGRSSTEPRPKATNRQRAGRCQLQPLLRAMLRPRSWPEDEPVVTRGCSPLLALCNGPISRYGHGPTMRMRPSPGLSRNAIYDDGYLRLRRLQSSGRDRRFQSVTNGKRHGRVAMSEPIGSHRDMRSGSAASPGADPDLVARTPIRSGNGDACRRVSNQLSTTSSVCVVELGALRCKAKRVPSGCAS